MQESRTMSKEKEQKNSKTIEERIERIYKRAKEHFGVITSYSIHYTKLYDLVLPDGFNGEYDVEISQLPHMNLINMFAFSIGYEIGSGLVLDMAGLE